MYGRYFGNYTLVRNSEHTAKYSENLKASAVLEYLSGMGSTAGMAFKLWKKHRVGFVYNIEVVN